MRTEKAPMTWLRSNINSLLLPEEWQEHTVRERMLLGRGGWPHQERRGHREAGFHSQVLLDSQKTGILCEKRNSGAMVKTSGHKNGNPKFCYPEESVCIYSPQVEHEGPLLMEAILWWHSLKETVDFLRLGGEVCLGEEMKCDVHKKAAMSSSRKQSHR